MLVLKTNEFKNMKESKRHGDELLPITQYCIRQGDGFSALDCHWHDEMELFRVMQGVVTLENRASRVLKNSILCLPNDVIIELYSAEEMKEMQQEKNQ